MKMDGHAWGLTRTASAWFENDIEVASAGGLDARRCVFAFGFDVDRLGLSQAGRPRAAGGVVILRGHNCCLESVCACRAAQPCGIRCRATTNGLAHAGEFLAE
jgi:hypothetical protein